MPAQATRQPRASTTTPTSGNAAMNPTLSSTEYNPIATGKEERLRLNHERIDYWVGHGAILSERVAKLVHDARKGAQAA